MLNEKDNMNKPYIDLKGVRVHNLKNIDLKIELNKLIVITGVSGSGKSSLAFDTLYAEGQRRYVESLSSYARQFLGRLNKPECDYIKGIPPAVAIEQKVNTSNPRSTVGTSTEIYDYIKLLYARAGQTISPISGREVKRDHTDDITRYILEDHLGKTVIILARPEHLQDVETLKLLLSQGFTRIKSGKAYHRIDDILAENKVLSNPSDLYLVIDRINRLYPVCGSPLRLLSSQNVLVALSTENPTQAKIFRLRPLPPIRRGLFHI